MDVALLVTCLTDTFFPRVGEAVVRVLRHFGCRVHFPTRQTCCGQPAYNSGFEREAAAVARRLLEVFAPYEHIVTPSASCATMIARHVPELFRGDPELHDAARSLASKTCEFSTFLTRRLGVDPAAYLRLSEPVTFHYPCHARDVYTPEQLADTLLRVHAAGLRPPRRVDLCCGFGGAFAVEFAEVSAAIAADRIDDLAGTGARLVVCNEGGCTLHLAGLARRRGLPLRFRHLAELLAESLGLMEPAP